MALHDVRRPRSHDDLVHDLEELEEKMKAMEPVLQLYRAGHLLGKLSVGLLGVIGAVIAIWTGISAIVHK